MAGNEVLNLAIGVQFPVTVPVICGNRLTAGLDVANVVTGVRFSLTAPVV